MPFIVTTKRPCADCVGGISKELNPDHQTWKPCESCADRLVGPTGSRIARVAVATLEEARTEAHAVIMRGPTVKADDLPHDAVFGYASAHTAIQSLAEAGGTVGPLPDGMTITVEAILWRQLAEAAGARWSAVVPGWDAKAIAAYNAKHGAA